jgi:hypothetical protein
MEYDFGPPTSSTTSIPSVLSQPHKFYTGYPTIPPPTTQPPYHLPPFRTQCPTVPYRRSHGVHTSVPQYTSRFLHCSIRIPKTPCSSQSGGDTALILDIIIFSHQGVIPDRVCFCHSRYHSVGPYSRVSDEFVDTLEPNNGQLWTLRLLET